MPTVANVAGCVDRLPIPHFTGPISTAAQIDTLGAFPIPVVMEFNYTNTNIAYLGEFVTSSRERCTPTTGQASV